MIIYILVLAVVQGLTEFLPVSSSGHLVLLNKFFGIESDFLLLSIILHVATLFAVLIVLRKSVYEIVRHPFGQLGKRLIVATLPTILIVVIFKKFFDASFDGRYLPICFMITAGIIVLSEFLSRKAKNINDVGYKNSIVMGIAQGFAVLPGISRSGSTICAGIASGVSREKSAQFSFLMSVPIILASMVLEIIEYASTGTAMGLLWYEIILGFFVAFIVGLLSVKFMLNLVQKHSLIPFAIYLVIISIVSFFVIF